MIDSENLPEEVRGVYYKDNSLERVASNLTGIKDQTKAIKEFFRFIESFHSGSKLLLLGSGGNSLTKDLEKKFPSMDFIPLDYRYGFYLEEKPTKSKIMIGGDWNHLPFSDQSIQGFICHHSFPYWATSTGTYESGFSEIDRVAKNDARMIFTGYGDTNWSMDRFLQASQKFSWETKVSIVDQEMDGSFTYRGISTKSK